MKRDVSYGVIPLQQRQGRWFLLAIQHSKALYWGFPKGHAEVGEEPKAAAERELAEETNLRIVRYLFQESLKEHYNFKWEGEMISKDVIYYVAEVEGDLRLQAAEVSGGKWVPLEEAAEAMTYEGNKSICRQVQAMIQANSP